MNEEKNKSFQEELIIQEFLSHVASLDKISSLEENIFEMEKHGYEVKNLKEKK